MKSLMAFWEEGDDRKPGKISKQTNHEADKYKSEAIAN